MEAMGNNEISTDGYADFFEDWFDERVNNSQIMQTTGNFEFSGDYKKQLFEQARKYE